MKKLLCLITAAACIICFCASAFATTIDTFDDWAAEPIGEDTAYAVVSCFSDAEEIIIPEDLDGKPVVSIAPHAFITNTTMKSLKLSDSLTEIGEFAFLDCSSLTKATLTPSLTTLGAAAFSGASSLSSINMNRSSVTAIEPYAFCETALTRINLPFTCTRIADHAFANCAELQAITIPSTVEEIGESAFSGCDRVTLICEEGSYAAAFAEEQGIPFRLFTIDHSYLNGDANGDGRITVMDATHVQRLLAHALTEDADAATVRGDVDGFGVTVVDATSIQRFLAKLGNPHGIGEPIGSDVMVTDDPTD